MTNRKKSDIQYKFTKEDRATIESIKTIVDGLAVFLGDSCEVLLHSLENLDKSIVHIVNGHITGRSIGLPITDLGIKILQENNEKEKDITGPYFTKTSKGKTLRSVTILIRNTKKIPIGFLCINFDMNTPLLNILKTFEHQIPVSDNSENPEKFFSNIEEMIKTILNETIKSINNQVNIPNLAKNKTIVGELYKKGIFNIRGAIDIVARELSVSRYTIYNYIHDNKLEQKEK